MIIATTYGVLALGATAVHKYGDGDTESDFYASYAPAARSLLDGKVQPSPYRGPLYPIAVAGVYAVLRSAGADLYPSAKVLSVICASVLLVIVYRLVLHLFSAATALITLFFTVTNPMFLRYSYTAGTDMMFALLVFATMFILLRPGGFGWRRIVAVATLGAACYMTRFNGVSVILGILLTVGILDHFGISRRQRTAASALVVLLSALCFLPYGLYTRSLLGSFFYNHNYENIIYSTFDPKGVASIGSFADLLLYDPIRMLWKIPVNIVVHSADALWYTGGPVAAVLVILFVGLRGLNASTEGQKALYVFAVSFLVVVGVVFFSSRFYLALVPIFAAAGVYRLETRLMNMNTRRGLRTIVVIAAVLGAAYSLGTAVYRCVQDVPSGLKVLCVMGEEFARKVPPTVPPRVVAARKPHFGYYAGMRTIPLPDVESEQELVEKLREEGADYLFFSYVAAGTRRQLTRLGNPELRHDGLMLMMSGRRGILYKLAKDSP